VSPSVSSISQDQQAQQAPKAVIPTQRRVTEQLTKHWSPFKALRQRYAGTRFEEQRQLHRPQKHKATVQDSDLRVEMLNLEEQADNAKARIRKRCCMLTCVFLHVDSDFLACYTPNMHVRKKAHVSIQSVFSMYVEI
jgi:hypothetical protein